MPEKISTIVLTKNSEQTLETTLKSLGFSDEIIVIDGGSEDQTIDIATRYSCKIYVRKETNFAFLRNFGNDVAQNSWVLHIDSDETVSNKLKEEILSTIENESISMYVIPRISFVNGKILNVVCPDYQCRLLNKNSGTSYTRRIHEIFLKDGHLLWALSYGTLTNPIIHMKRIEGSLLIRLFKAIRSSVREAITVGFDDYNFVSFRGSKIRCIIRPYPRAIMHIVNKLKNKPRNAEDFIYLVSDAIFYFVYQVTVNALKLMQKD